MGAGGALLGEGLAAGRGGVGGGCLGAVAPGGHGHTDRAAGDRALTRREGGCRALARLHGGEVSVTSTLGQGTIFTIELPRR